MGYPWAQGVAKAADTSLSSSMGGYGAASVFPDFCPGVDDGVFTECDKFESRAAEGDIAVVSCRGMFLGHSEPFVNDLLVYV